MKRRTPFERYWDSRASSRAWLEKHPMVADYPYSACDLAAEIFKAGFLAGKRAKGKGKP
jgi:hypothetical protein